MGKFHTGNRTKQCMLQQRGLFELIRICMFFFSLFLSLFEHVRKKGQCAHISCCIPSWLDIQRNHLFMWYLHKVYDIIMPLCAIDFKPNISARKTLCKFKKMTLHLYYIRNLVAMTLPANSVCLILAWP